MKLRFKQAFVFFILITNFAILFDVPFFSHILGFLFLSFLPGLLILQLIPLGKSDTLEKIILSVGISISFLMIVGLFINQIFFYFGYQKPLSQICLLITLSLIYGIFAIIILNTKGNFILNIPALHLLPNEKIVLLIPSFFPTLALIGIWIMNSSSNNIIIIVLYMLICIYIIIISIFSRQIPERLYALILFLISLSLLLLLAFRSNYIVGSDIHTEYYLFMKTFNNLHWEVFGTSILDASISITLLPTIYASFLKINPVIVFKTLYSIIYSISPHIIYIISRKYLDSIYAFIASLFFMFQYNFIMTASNSRTNMAIFFFALTIMILYNSNIIDSKKRFLVILFTISATFSHYSTTYIYFFVFCATFVGEYLVSQKYTFKKSMRLQLIILFFCIIFMWYAQITNKAFSAGIHFIQETINTIDSFFLEEARGQSVQVVLGSNAIEKGIPHKLELILTWLIFGYIGTGILESIRKYKQVVFISINNKKLDFLKQKFDAGYFINAIVCSFLLVAMITLPFVSKGYNITRLYALTSVTLSTFFVIGGLSISKKIQISPHVILLLLLIPYFLSITGLTYDLFGFPKSIIIDSTGESYDLMYVHDQENYAIRWIKSNAIENSKIYSDAYGTARLISQGSISSPKYAKSLIDDKKDTINGLFYLRYTGAVKNKLRSFDGTNHNISEFYPFFSSKSLIYKNGGSNVYI